MIYFLHIDSGDRKGTVKVGTSERPGHRSVVIATTLRCSVTLYAVMPGGLTEEAAAHEALAEHLVRFGEECEFFCAIPAIRFAHEHGARVVEVSYSWGDEGQAASMRALDTAHTSTAREMLGEWCRERGRVSDLARSIGIERSTIHRWIMGKSRPSPLALSDLERITGICRDAWNDPRAARRTA